MRSPGSKLLNLQVVKHCLARVSIGAERGEELWSFKCLFKLVRTDAKGCRLLAKCQLRSCHGQSTYSTVASQQIRTSYRAPCVRPSSRIHVSTPSGASSVGNDALILVLAVVWNGDIGIRYRSSRFGCSVGSVIVGGPRKMVFSTFADTIDANDSNGSKEAEKKCILDVPYVGTGLNQRVKAL